jgi:hypothetical protein
MASPCMYSRFTGDVHASDADVYHHIYKRKMPMCHPCRAVYQSGEQQLAPPAPKKSGTVVRGWVEQD